MGSVKGVAKGRMELQLIHVDLWVSLNETVGVNVWVIDGNTSPHILSPLCFAGLSLSFHAAVQ